MNVCVCERERERKRETEREKDREGAREGALGADKENVRQNEARNQTLVRVIWSDFDLSLSDSA